MKKQQIKFYRYPHPTNLGDTLTPYILRHFLPEEDFVSVNREESGKLIAVGSIMHVINPGDTIWGSGVIRSTETFPQAKDCRFLAIRGKLSRDIIIRDGGTVPEIYGDPAVLLPLMFTPKKVKKTHTVAIVPHFVDSYICTPEVCSRLAKGETYKIVDILQGYESFIQEIMTCKRVVSSSLHGLIISEAYGLPVEWVVLSQKVIGNGFKFQDYLTGTERPQQKPGVFPKLSKTVLSRQQKALIDALSKL